MHAADVMCELAVADDLETQFLWNSESAGVGRGQRRGAAQPAHDHRHRRRRRARRPRRRRRVVDLLHPLLAARPPAVISLEDGIRRITHLPAMICGIKNRGLIARGYHADVMLFDPDAPPPRQEGAGAATCPAASRAGRCGREGVVRVLVNGETIVENGELTGARAGRVLRVGNPKPGRLHAEARIER